MKFLSSTKEYVVGGALLLSCSSPAWAHPGLSETQQTKPCPFLADSKLDSAGEGWQQAPMRALAGRDGDGGIPVNGGFEAVKEDLKALLTDSQDFWPADFIDTADGPSYAGLWIRLAWHCSGSYRQSDGRGGCDGGRIRFSPEAQWPDNGNLDNARALLEDIKNKYGDSLSWGDLIILAGNVAIEASGGPILGFCGGRVDDKDGSNSLQLGPSDEQEEIGPCQTVDMQGQCLAVEGTALGPTTVGLIYVNPAGPVYAVGDPAASGEDIRLAFSRMGFNDTETVALVGGGHAFGKVHGACPDPPCGDGKGNNTYTSGFEGQWTTAPTKWTNQYFNNLFDFDWNNITGPGGELQWAPTARDGTTPPDIIMLTADLALSVDEDYKPLSQTYADDITALESDFAKAWYRLTTQDMGPMTRCIGDDVPEAQPFQNALDDSPDTLPDFVPIRSAIQDIIDNDESSTDAFINLAYNCASTFRATDYRGGCNGARIRFPPESTWESNAGSEDAISMLTPIQSEFPGVSYADLIVLAGITALEHENESLDLPFCGGAVDALDADASDILAPRVYSTPYITVTDDFLVKGLTMEEGVALASRRNVGSQFYNDLMAAGDSNESDFSENELALLEGDLLEIVTAYADSDDEVHRAFKGAWVKMMTADRFKDHRENACTGVSTKTLAVDSNPDPENPTSTSSASKSFLAAVGAFLFLSLYM